MNFLKNKLILLVLFLVLISIVLIIFFSFKSSDVDTIKAENKDFQKIIEISGKVVPAEEVELNFNASSNVIKVYKDIGDKVIAGEILAEIDSSQVRDEISEAVANVSAVEAELSKISGSNNNASQISIAKENLVKNLKRAYVNADLIIRNTVDLFFVDANTINAEFKLSLGLDTRIINDGREDMQDIIEDWAILNSDINSTNFSNSDIQYVIDSLNQIDDYISLISSKSSDFEPESEITQNQIDSYISGLGSARSNLANIIIDINNSINTLNNLELDIPIQDAKIQNSLATVSRLQSKASDYVLRAPFTGIITENNLEIGRYVSTSDVAFVLISDSQLEIETFIPEINIVGVDLGDSVVLKFDALPNLKIDAVVTHIDPKETIKDGVVTYRVLINLLEPNNDLRPGMSSDIEIIKYVELNQLVIPSYVISSDEQGDFVQVMQDKESVKKYIDVVDKNNRLEALVSGNISTEDNIIIPK